MSIPQTMQAMVLTGAGQPLVLQALPVPDPSADELLIKVSTCAVCRTDLHVVDGELEEPSLPLIPGHQIVGEVVAVGDSKNSGLLGRRVGVPWLGGSCDACDYCDSGMENLCDDAVYTGYQRNGGFAEYVTARTDYCFPVPEAYSDQQAAPLLCAGLIGYRAWQMALATPGQLKRIGFFGFGAAAHILTQLARHQQKEVYAFTRAGDEAAQAFALKLGAIWVGDSQTKPEHELDAAILFAPAGELVPAALKTLRKGGRVVCAGIHMSDIPAFPYEALWGERSIVSVANLTRRDGEEFLPLAAAIPVETDVKIYPLGQANRALDDLREGHFTGAAVIQP